MKLRDTRLKNIELKDTIDLMLSSDYKERFKSVVMSFYMNN